MFGCKSQHGDLGPRAATVQQNGGFCAEPGERRQRACELATNDEGARACVVDPMRVQERGPGASRGKGKKKPEYFGFCSDYEEMRCTYVCVGGDCVGSLREGVLCCVSVVQFLYGSFVWEKRRGRIWESKGGG